MVVLCEAVISVHKCAMKVEGVNRKKESGRMLGVAFVTVWLC